MNPHHCQKLKEATFFLIGQYNLVLEDIILTQHLNTHGKN